MKFRPIVLLVVFILTRSTFSNSALPLDSIPSELKDLMLANASIRNILNFCQASKKQQPLCDNANSRLWEELVVRDFGKFFTEAKESFATWTDLTWKEFYVNLTKRQRATLAASNHTVVIDDTGYVWTFGKEGDGQLGRSESSLVPKKLEGLPKMVSAAAGYRHSVLLDNNGEVWTFGQGDNGQLGHGTNQLELRPRKIENIGAKIVSIAAGNNHTVLLDTMGRVWTFGAKGQGELGHKDIAGDQFTPKMIEELLVKIVYLAAGAAHTVLLDFDGGVWTFGRGNSGALGHGMPQEENLSHQPVPKKIGSLPANIVAVAAGAYFTVVLDAENSAWAFGHGVFGQLGINRFSYESVPNKIENLPTKIVSMTAGTYHAVFLLADTKVWTVGASETRIGLTTTGDEVPREIKGLTGIVSVTAGYNSTIALSDIGRVWTYGSGTHGQLGHGNTKDAVAPQRIRKFYTKHYETFK